MATSPKRNLKILVLKELVSSGKVENMKYFKKKKMYELVQVLGYTDMPSLKYCTYSFHRGYEKLDFCLDSGNFVHFSFCRPGNYFVVREQTFDDEMEQYEVVRYEVIFFKEFLELLSDDISADMPLYIAKN